MENKRLNIGLLVGKIDDFFSNGLTYGAINASEELDVNLIIIPGRYIDIKSTCFPDAAYEYQFNTLFSHVSADNLDLIAICIGSIAYTSTQELKAELLSQYGNVPIITIADEIAGYEYVKFNNESGIKDAVNYLVKEQGRTKFGMVSGFLSHRDSLERFNALKAALSANQIDFDEKSVVYADLSRRCETEVDELLDRNPDIDTIICSNDEMACTVYDALKKRNIAIGKDIAVVGFDDLPYASKMTPPLASINASAYELGYEAITKGYGILTGGQYRRGIINTKFIPRQSSGNAHPEYERITSALGSSSSADSSCISSEIQRMFTESTNLSRTEAVTLRSALNDIFPYVFACFTEGKSSPENADMILRGVESALHRAPKFRIYVDKIYLVVDVTYKWLTEHINDETTLELLKDTYTKIYKRFAEEICNEAAVSLNKSVLVNHSTNIVIRDMLMFENSLESSFAATLKKVSYLGIKSSYIFTFPHSVAHHYGEPWVCQQSWLLKAVQFGNEVIAVPNLKQRLHTSELFTHEYFPKDRRVTMVMAPLFSNEYQYGMYLCEMSADSFSYLELLTYQLSAAVKIIELLKQQEDSMLRLHENNLELDTIARLDELTGLFNRRGFNKAAKEFLQSATNTNKIALIAYADMDNLKIINDKYGHIEGDFSLKALADILRKTFRFSDIVGRVGGDEFVALAITEEAGLEGVIRSRMNKYITEFNKTCDKPYNINMSMGIYEFSCLDGISLEDAMDRADDMLYEVKKKRKLCK